MGDAAALERLYRAWFGFVFEEARRVSRRDESFCLDVVQEVMMKVMRSLPPIQTRSQLGAWLALATLSATRDRVRSELRRTRREQRAVTGVANPAGNTPDWLERRELLEKIEHQLSGLEAGAEHLISARFRFGWTLTRIARGLGIGVGATDGRIARLLESFRRFEDVNTQRFKGGQP